MPHVLVLNDIHQDGLALLQGTPGFTVTAAGDFTPQTLPERLAEADSIIVRGTAIDRALLQQAPRIRFVCRHGVGFDNVDLAATSERNIVVAVTPEANARSVAEHALMMMLALSRRVATVSAAVRGGQWRSRTDRPTYDLAGATVLLIGFGRIGARVARLCEAFGMQTLVHDPFILANTIRALGFTPAPDRAAALARADIVSLHCPSSPATRGMVDAVFLAAMKPGAMLINTARGTLIDETALEAALRSGHLAAAGLDVLRQEPMTTTIPLLALDTVLVTPHVAASTQQGLRRMALAAAQNTIDFFADRLDRDAIVEPPISTPMPGGCR